MVEFNTGFITAIALFLEHKNFTSQIVRKNGKVLFDTRLYTASDHLYNMEFKGLSKVSLKLAKRISKWRAKCFKHRMDCGNTTKIANELFKEGEDILAQIDKQIFKTKKVRMNYR